MYMYMADSHENGNILVVHNFNFIHRYIFTFWKKGLHTIYVKKTLKKYIYDIVSGKEVPPNNTSKNGIK